MERIDISPIFESESELELSVSKLMGSYFPIKLTNISDDINSDTDDDYDHNGDTDDGYDHLQPVRRK